MSRFFVFNGYKTDGVDSQTIAKMIKFDNFADRLEAYVLRKLTSVQGTKDPLSKRFWQTFDDYVVYYSLSVDRRDGKQVASHIDDLEKFITDGRTIYFFIPKRFHNTV
ncbi:uncharacterized protein LOC143446327 isoform X1 [Clavelina lepadiformis]|uniref:Uncharacterized protein n=1 Tax=Clavelina lepadiformis TaxID=159417 RepID=A0ABP0GTB4_CLALP